MTIMGWVGNAFLIAGLYTMSPKRRWPFLLSLAGDGVWLAVSVYRWSPDLMFLCSVFCGLAVYNYAKWGKR